MGILSLSILSLSLFSLSLYSLSLSPPLILFVCECVRMCALASVAGKSVKYAAHSLSFAEHGAHTRDMTGTNVHSAHVWSGRSRRTPRAHFRLTPDTRCMYGAHTRSRDNHGCVCIHHENMSLKRRLCISFQNYKVSK